MSDERGVLYVIWGDKVEGQLNRSIASLKRHHPELAIEVKRVTVADPQRPFAEKAKMGLLSPFKTTLYLDADTVVMGNLNYAFDRAEQFGIACCINECPWTRRYGPEEGDGVEYNAGVVFFSERARQVMNTYAEIVPTTPARSRWMTMDNSQRGLLFDDQACLAKAVQIHNFNPFVLPLNYNFRPMYYKTAFAPMKIWHASHEPPASLLEISAACEQNRRPVTYLEFHFKPGSPPAPTNVTSG